LGERRMLQDEQELIKGGGGLALRAKINGGGPPKKIPVKQEGERIIQAHQKKSEPNKEGKKVFKGLIPTTSQGWSCGVGTRKRRKAPKRKPAA